MDESTLAVAVSPVRRGMDDQELARQKESLDAAAVLIEQKRRQLECLAAEKWFDAQPDLLSATLYPREPYGGTTLPKLCWGEGAQVPAQHGEIRRKLAFRFEGRGEVELRRASVVADLAAAFDPSGAWAPKWLATLEARDVEQAALPGRGSPSRRAL